MFFAGSTKHEISVKFLFATKSMKQWRLRYQSTCHVRSEENRADAAIWGLDAMTPKKLSLWWLGPSSLSILWIPDQPKLTKVGAERGKIAVVNSSHLVEPNLDALNDLERFSSL